MRRTIKYTTFALIPVALLCISATLAWKWMHRPEALLQRWTGVILSPGEAVTDVKYAWAGWSESYRHFHITDQSGRIRGLLLSHYGLVKSPGAQSAKSNWLPTTISTWDTYVMSGSGGTWANPEVMLWHEPASNQLILELWHW